MEQRECPICGNSFTANCGRQKYCSKDCREKFEREIRKSNREDALYRERNKDNINRVNKNRMELMRINKKAKKEGLTYGQYVARHGII